MAAQLERFSVPVPDEAHRGGAMWLAGEASGDALAGIVLPAVSGAMGGALQFGIGGERMREAGLEAWRDASVLSVRGYVEVLKRLPALLKLRRDVIAMGERVSPRVFVGVDAPDFNLGVEEKLRARGIPTVHFVSPSVWAWRPERIENVRRAASLVLLIFPFEEEIYRKAGIPAVYVGHPMARGIPEVPDTAGARARIGAAGDGPLIALLPGSRYDEIRWNGPVFLETARRFLRMEPSARFVLPASDGARRAQVAMMLGKFGDVSARLQLIAGRSHDALEACDAALVASGTATLEAALYKKPMVVGYKMPAVSSLIMQSKARIPYASLPNILAGRRVVPEFLQFYADPAYMAVSLAEQLEPSRSAELREVFSEMHASLRRDTPALAAQAIAEVAGGRAP